MGSRFSWDRPKHLPMSLVAMCFHQSRIFRGASFVAAVFGALLAVPSGHAQDYYGQPMIAADGTRPVDRKPLFTFDLRVGYDSNVNATYNNKIGSGFFNIGGGVVYTAGSP